MSETIKIPKIKDPKKVTEIAIMGVILAAFIGLGIYIITQINKLSNICYFITGGTINSISAEKVSVSLLIGIKNISSFNVTLTGINLDIYVNGNYISNITQSVNNVITPESISTISFEIAFNPNDLVNAGNNILTAALSNGGDISINTVGTASISLGSVSVSNYPVNDTVTMAQLQSNQGSGYSC